METTAAAESLSRALARGGYYAGPLVAALIGFVLPLEGVSPGGRATLAMMAWMAIWWMTEAIDIHATALLPLVVLPLTGAATFGEAALPYASEIVFLFLGGFLLAQAMQRWGLDRRLALRTLEKVGTRPSRVVGGIMLATAAISAFVSNTATAAMMLPIALGVARWADRPREGTAVVSARELADFRTALMLAVAYASTIGGFTTLLGTPPNGIFAAYCRDHLGKPISFLSWLWVGLPCAALLLPLAWWLLTKRLFRLPNVELGAGAEHLREDLRALGSMSSGEWRTIAIFFAAVLLWIFRPVLHPALQRLDDAGVAMAAGLLLFVVPSGRSRGEKLLAWRDAERISWGVLLLFGGGLSLARAIDRNGVGELLGGAFGDLKGLPPWLLVFLVTATIVFIGELASNVAVAATMLPLLHGLAPSLGLPPERLLLPAALAASCSFMLPAGTPPNAIVFGSGHVTIPQMVRAGWWLNWIAIFVVSFVASTIAERVGVIG